MLQRLGAQAPQTPQRCVAPAPHQELTGPWTTAFSFSFAQFHLLVLTYVVYKHLGLMLFRCLTPEERPWGFLMSSPLSGISRLSV